MILVCNIDGTPLSAAEALANEIELLYFARRSNEVLWEALNKVDSDRQHELEIKMTEMIHDALVKVRHTALQELLDWTDKGVTNYGERSCIQRKIKEMIGK